MSYILEALKKSEFQRQQGRVPDINALPANIGAGVGATAGPGRSGLLLAGVAMLVLAGAGVLWWQPWQRREAPASAMAETTQALPRRAQPDAVPPGPPPVLAVDTPAPAAAASVPAAAVPAMPAAPQPLPGAVSQRSSGPEAAPRSVKGQPEAATRPPVAPQAKPAVEPSAKPAASVAQQARAAAQAAATAAKTAPVPAVAPAAPPPARSAASAAPAARPAAGDEGIAGPPPARILNFSELPPAIRSSIPALTVSGYSYAEEADVRMAVINDRMLREGDEAGPGVSIERIGAEGVVLNFKGYRFRPAP